MNTTVRGHHFVISQTSLLHTGCFYRPDLESILFLPFRAVTSLLLYIIDSVNGGCFVLGNKLSIDWKTAARLGKIFICVSRKSIH